ncbi:guanylate kinase [Mycoplasma haemofelis str. Langford 1]|uniref:Guanylate kinase n=2 Tax=Mycoplasma haemofelis TaxID=29501 RepID=F6FGF5_MYCHI|nr:guanylate kinase [Mycoplasma haemofelis]AEG72545.1 guanylate kinase [Mycoplasma haemofelis Ohio2]CBY92230.1 guanylate kinase [Mycoplasma haemofelis str. Langford 1]
MGSRKLGKLFIISGPSGVGKGAIIERLLSNKELNLIFSISHTTRSRRSNEVDGVNYFFITKEQFRLNIESGKMLEYAQFFDNYYGTSKEWVENRLREGRNVLLEIETIGFKQMLEKKIDLVSIFIAPPSMQELEDRLKNRGTESGQDVKIRLEKATSEMEDSALFQHVVVNDILEDAVREIEGIFLSQVLNEN